MRRRIRWPLFLVGCAGASLVLAGVGVQCSGPSSHDPQPVAAAPRASVADAEAVSAWDVVYRVLQHPRCLNCHPAANRPLVGDSRGAHPQNVQRGPDGQGLYAMKCATCHSSANTPGAHMPPGAPNWHLPSPKQPLVFEGKSSGELCRQMRDRKANGDKTPEQLVEHMAHDPLVLWGWDPGEGRVAVSTTHAAFAEAARTWAAKGCGCPD
jgi:mono/diheme cytochrome c family protein